MIATALLPYLVPDTRSKPDLDKIVQLLLVWLFYHQNTGKVLIFDFHRVQTSALCSVIARRIQLSLSLEILKIQMKHC